MLRTHLAGSGALLVVVLVLSGCVGAEPSDSSCPTLGPEHFGLDGSATVADPEELAESVGLGGLLEGTCAYGFVTDDLSAVAFHIADPSAADLETFSETSEQLLLDAGFEEFRPTPRGVIERNPDGVQYSIAYFEEFGPDDGISPRQFEDMGLVDGEPLLTGGIAIPRTD